MLRLGFPDASQSGDALPSLIAGNGCYTSGTVVIQTPVRLLRARSTISANAGVAYLGGIFARMITQLGSLARADKDGHEIPTVAIIDSETVRGALPQAEKGIDGGKKIKGIKRYLAVDSNGYPLAVVATKGNIQDGKAAHLLTRKTITQSASIKYIKTDNGHRGNLSSLLPQLFDIELQCVKSNSGTKEFKPTGGRWVVERTFSWLTSFRRLCRNYVQYLTAARAMAEVACVMFMLRFG